MATRRSRLAKWTGIVPAGAALALGAFALAWFDHQRLLRTGAGEAASAATGAGFLLLGLIAGWRLFGRRAARRPPGNPAAVAALGISGRELDVLHALAAGRANKEIARELGVSPNTVKTHVARLYEKLAAQRRTDAVAKARSLGILP